MLLLLASGCPKASPESSCDWMSLRCDWITVASSAEITTQSLPAEYLAQEQNAVVSTYVNDIVLQSLSQIASADSTVACDWISSTTSLPLASGCKLPADSCDCSLKPSAEYDDITDDIISTNPSAEQQHDVASSLEPSADCDDIKADVITAHSISSASSHLLNSSSFQLHLRFFFFLNCDC
ncbi:hypothetical protein F511_30819 [Dorcoceras hygrometricum]|uniref:Uncharacterized protein n=1 Tax=Dorcoceras hygrometricum TaxID=472368 RepID=A0A2Z7AEB2_9LAMI|nr:hypothetical protein F511_30819 [Dorcoceras hygrometricum]